jgi:hypothetical protein
VLKRSLCALALAAASVGIIAPDAHAARPCVTKAEYRAVHDGMTKHRVHRIFDTRGRQEAFARSGRFTSEVRSYRTCRRGSAVSVSFGNRRVTAKSAVWL